MEIMSNIVIEADLGQPHYHVGDEAMATAVVRELRARLPLAPVLLTRDVEQTTTLQGVRAAMTVAMPLQRAAAQHEFHRLQDLLRTPGSSLFQDPVLGRAALEISSAKALVIAGGGNLSSVYPHLLYERSLLAQLAEHYGVPVVMTGQTFGPALTDHDDIVLRELLGRCTVVAAREATSFGWAAEVGIPPERLALVTDDATFLAPVDPGLGNSVSADSHRSIDGSIDVPEQYILATVAPVEASGQSDVLGRIAAVLDRVQRASGLPVLLLPHMAELGRMAGTADLRSHEVVVANADNPHIRSLPILPVDAAVSLTAGAQLVITNRYHPSVFAAANAVPLVALSMDGYSDVRISGAMSAWGLQESVIPLPGLYQGDFQAAVEAALSSLADVRKHLTVTRPALKAAADRWWDAVAEVVQGNPFTGATVPSVPPIGGTAPSADLHSWFQRSDNRRVLAECVAEEAAAGLLEANARADAVAAELLDLRNSRAHRMMTAAWTLTASDWRRRRRMESR